MGTHRQTVTGHPQRFPTSRPQTTSRAKAPQNRRLVCAPLEDRRLLSVAARSVSFMSDAVAQAERIQIAQQEETLPFNYTITASGTQDVTTYPEQRFNWTVTGTGTETWTSTRLAGED